MIFGHAGVIVAMGCVGLVAVDCSKNIDIAGICVDAYGVRGCQCPASLVVRQQCQITVSTRAWSRLVTAEGSGLGQGLVT